MSNFGFYALVFRQKYIRRWGLMRNSSVETLSEHACEVAVVAHAMARIGNRYITETEPWKVWKTDPERVKTILHVCLQLTANLSIAFEPFLPFSSARLREMLNLQSFRWDQLGTMDILAPGHRLGEPALLFEKIDDAAIEAQLQKLEDMKRRNEEEAYTPEPVKENVAFDDFEKLDIRVGLVTACEKV